jgi:hypothetical protein
MRDLTYDEVVSVDGGYLANIGAGIGGATISMAGYAMYGVGTGYMDFGGFAGAGVTGFVVGATFNNPISYAPAAAAGGAVDGMIDS